MLPVDDPPNAVPDIYRHRFERCFRDHYAQMLAFSMRRVCGREVAEDVVADTFAVAWRRRDRIPDPALPWLYAIASHVLADQYRSTRRRHNLDMLLVHEIGAVAPGVRSRRVARLSRLARLATGWGGPGERHGVPCPARLKSPVAEAGISVRPIRLPGRGSAEEPP